MISSELTEIRIQGVEKLFNVFPRDYSFSGAYLKGLLLHDNGDLQLTYSIKTEKTYIIVFIMSECEDLTGFCVTANKKNIEGIDISTDYDDTLRFVDNSNEIDIVCHGLKITTHVILSKVFAKEQAKILTKQYSVILQQKFDCLEKLYLDNNKPLFRRDDSYNGIHADHHTMYKLDDLHNKDKSIYYEFLIELDRNDPCIGIYYGCKGLIKSGDNLEQQNVLRNEWLNLIKPKVLERLNRLFPGKKFDNRFKPTDNANDNTFWPFWISLYEDENMLEVAARATLIIREEYKRYLEGDNYMPDETCKYIIKTRHEDIDKSEVHSESRFTEESWEELREPWTIKDSSDSKKYKTPYITQKNKEWANLLDKFIEGAIRENFIEEHVSGYEKAFMFKMSTTCFAVMMQLLVNRMQQEESVPWKLLCKQFLNKKGGIYSDNVLKNSNTRYWNTKKEKYPRMFEKWGHEERIRWEKDPYKADDFTKKFRIIMN